MPRISEFFGIVIYVYWRDHGPPHFHAVYGDDEVLIAIDDLSVLEGKASPRVLGLVLEWARLHQEELPRLASGSQPRAAQQDRPAHVGVPVMLYRIVSAEARPDYRVWVRFEDGVEGEADLSDLVGQGVFKRWEDPAQFATVQVDSASGTLTWAGGLDVAPDELYREVAGITSR